MEVKPIRFLKPYRFYETKKKKGSKKIKEADQLLREKQMTVDYLEKMIEIAQAELKIDIKKHYNAFPSADAVPTEKK